MAHNEIANSPQRGEQQSSPGSQMKLARRQFLTTGTVATATAFLPGSGTAEAKPPGKAAHTKTFPQPPSVFPDRDGDTDFGDVHLDLNTFTFCDGTSGQVRSYNGDTPGPTLVVNPGRKLTLTLYNDLPPNPAAGAPNDHCGQPDAMNNPNCFNSTNIHFHGLHTSPCSIWGDGLPDCGPGHTGQPKVAGDDVLFEIPPIVQGGKPQEYCVWLPRFHAPGTHWYHAHKHGSSAIQVANGLAGALIVRERRPLVRPGNDFVWLIQEALPTTDDWKIYPPPFGPGDPQTFFFINGECQPTLRTNAGKTLRLRFINATGTPRGFTRLQIVQCSSDPDAVCDDAVPPDTEPTKTIYLMAVDGITFYGHKPQPKPWWDTSPGSRADFLVQFAEDEVGVYKVVKSLVQNSPQAAIRQVLGYIEVRPGFPFPKEPEPQDIPLPPWRAAPDYLQPIQESEISATQTVEFQNPTAENFLISVNNAPGKKYDHAAFDLRAPLGCAQAWTLLNSGMGGMMSFPHPFHVHINPFQLADAPPEIKLMDTSGPDVPENRIWWDTIPIPPEQGGTPGRLVMWTRFLDYPGTFVLHCHILVHEDLGMMANVLVEDPFGEGAGPCEPLRRPVRVTCQT
jgi:FtsP/CotA-like multicopper oxidase with cupredoxin domain